MFCCSWRHLISIRALSLSEDGIRQLASVSLFVGMSMAPAGGMCVKFDVAVRVVKVV